jgi:hypothetical protein
MRTTTTRRAILTDEQTGATERVIVVESTRRPRLRWELTCATCHTIARYERRSVSACPCGSINIAWRHIPPPEERA